MVTVCIADFTEHFISKKIAGNQRQIVGACIMLGIMKTVCIHKMGICASHFLGAFIHQRHKIVNGAGDIFAGSIGRLVGGSYHDSIETFLQRNGFALIHTHIGAICRHAENGLVTKFYHVVQTTVLHGKECGHNFCGTCGIKSFVNIFGVKDHARIGVHKDGGLRANLGACGPVVDFVGLYGQCLAGFNLFLQFFQTGCFCSQSIVTATAKNQKKSKKQTDNPSGVK